MRITILSYFDPDWLHTSNAEWDKTDAFVVELARPTDSYDMEVTILQIRDTLYPKRVLFIPPIARHPSTEQQEWMTQLEQITATHHLPFLNPSKLFETIHGMYQTDVEYTDRGKIIAEYEYEKAIQQIPMKPRCIHRYLTQCNTVQQSPGLADFLRGTIALYQFSKTYDYDIRVDRDHPVFTYLTPSRHITYHNPFSNTIEILPPQSYDEIYNKVEELFKTSNSFCILTNSNYYKVDGRTINFGPISDDCKAFMKELLTPNAELTSRIQDIFTNVYHLQPHDAFKVIHLRFGDDFLHDGTRQDDGIYTHYRQRVQNALARNRQSRCVLLADSSIMANRLKQDIPELLYWDNTKVHLGDLVNNTESSILDTLTDFFIISKATEIMTIHHSGFTRVNSILYDIPYTYI